MIIDARIFVIDKKQWFNLYLLIVLLNYLTLDLSDTHDKKDWV